MGKEDGRVDGIYAQEKSGERCAKPEGATPNPIGGAPGRSRKGRPFGRPPVYKLIVRTAGYTFWRMRNALTKASSLTER